MGVVFFGASKLGFACCKALIEQNIEISAIFSIPKKFSVKYKGDLERKQVENCLYEDFTYFQREYNIPVHYVEGNIKDFESYLKDLNPELIIVIGWYYMVNDSILKIPKYGSCAIHASLLPKYRGNAPLVWAMINNEKTTGVSFFYLEKGVDEGDIIAQSSFEIDSTDTIKEVLLKAEEASLNIIKMHVPKILNETSTRTIQDNSKATYFPKRSPEDGEINWNWDSEKINCFIKAQTHPYPGAFTIIDNKKVVIWDALVTNVNT